MRARTILTMAIALMLVAAIPVVAVAGERRSAPMHVLGEFGPLGVIDGTSVQVNATGNQARITVKTTDLYDGHAYTIWSFSFSTPGACVDGCGEDDAADRPNDVGFAVNQVAGHVVGNGDHANFGGKIRVDDAAGAEYHIVVADHGPMDPALLPDQIKTPSLDGVQIGIILP